MTPDTLVFIIVAFCSIKDPTVSKDYKFDCMEFINNCSVTGAGEISNTKVDECREKWIRNSKLETK